QEQNAPVIDLGLGELPLEPPREIGAGAASGQEIDDLEADVVPRSLVFRPGVAQAHHQFPHGSAPSRPRSAVPGEGMRHGEGDRRPSRYYFSLSLSFGFSSPPSSSSGLRPINSRWAPSGAATGSGSGATAR